MMSNLNLGSSLWPSRDLVMYRVCTANHCVWQRAAGLPCKNPHTKQFCHARSQNLIACLQRTCQVYVVEHRLYPAGYTCKPTMRTANSVSKKKAVIGTELTCKPGGPT